MFISIMFLSLNAGIIYTAWMSNISLVEKVVLTVILIAKIIFFYSMVWLGQNRKIKKIGACVLIAINVGVIVYSFFCREYYLAVPTVAALLLFGVWSFTAIFDCNFRNR